MGIETPPREPSLMLTVNDALNLLQISRNSIYELFASGDLTKFHIAGRTLVRRADVMRLIERSMALPAKSRRKCAKSPPAVSPAGIAEEAATRRLAAARAAQTHPQLPAVDTP